MNTHSWKLRKNSEKQACPTPSWGLLVSTAHILRVSALFVLMLLVSLHVSVCVCVNAHILWWIRVCVRAMFMHVRLQRKSGVILLMTCGRVCMYAHIVLLLITYYIPGCTRRCIRVHAHAFSVLLWWKLWHSLGSRNWGMHWVAVLLSRQAHVCVKMYTSMHDLKQASHAHARTTIMDTTQLHQQTHEHATSTGNACTLNPRHSTDILSLE